MMMREYWENLAGRERVALAIGAGILCLALFYVMVHEPLHNNLARARTTLNAEVETLAQLESTVAAAGQLRAGVAADTRLPDGQSPVAFINSSAAAFSVESYIRQITPRGNLLTVVMEAAPFDDVAAWLADLARKYNLHVSRVSLDRVNGANGAVNLNLVFSTARTAP